MAFFNDLVKAVAEAEGMELMTVRGIGLNVRDGGYIAKSGRGLSAARMTVRDAANLLIGVNASAMAKDAASAVEPYRSLSGHIGQPDPLKILQRDGDFGTCLERLLESFTHNDQSDVFSRR